MTKTKKAGEDIVKERGDAQIKMDFVPIDESDLAGAVDVPVKEKRTEIIEEFGKKLKSKREVNKNSSKKSTKKTAKKKNGNWVESFKIPGSKKLDSKGPVLIITEKPQSAMKIADALSEGKVKTNTLGGVKYYEFARNGKYIQVVAAVGHLFSLAQVNQRNKWPTFEIKWAPNYLVRKNDFTKKYYDVIAKLCRQASSFIVATDYDIEGEVIGMNIIRFICNQTDAQRMKFSTLTSNEIKHSYEIREKSLNWRQGIAGETRHYLDWMYGINLSRALMEAIKTTGKFRLMSIGRVQGPALHIIVEKEKEIQAFISEKYWQVFLEINDGKNNLEVKYVKDITKEYELDGFKKLDGRNGIAKTKKSQQKISPPTPFDLTTLQTEAYKFFRLTPSRTLQIAQSLYLSGIISYPRTSSQKIPKEIGYDKILDRLKQRFDFVKNISKKTPVEGRKTDPAHPSIFPTGEFHKVEDDEKKIYELIVKRFVSCFCDDAVLDDKRIDVDVDGKKFFAKGMAINKKGWMEVYPSLLKEKEIIDMDGNVKVKKVKIEEKMTQPPKRYTPASIVSELEKRNLGTKATRASIIETLYDRGYVQGKSIEATSLGMALINTLEKNCDIIIDEKLTRNIERDLESVRMSKDPLKKEEKILEEAKNSINKIGEKFEINKRNIGNDLVNATEKLWTEQKKDNEIMPCSKCNKGQLTIKYNQASKRYFIACNAYPECKETYSLPPNALIKKSDKICEYCNWPMLISIKKGKRPWIFCFNPNCESKKKEN